MLGQSCAFNLLTCAFLLYRQITGTLGDLELLTNMRDFAVYNNSIAGSIPSSIGKMTSLRKLQLDENSLTGTIPTEIGVSLLYWPFIDKDDVIAFSSLIQLQLLVNIVDLELEKNPNLSGTIPTEIG